MPVIPTLDLVAQHAPLRAELELAAARVLGSGRFILGEEVAVFERAIAEAAGVAHAVGVSSGTDALLAMLMALGVGPGDEVITTPYSFIATAEAIVRLGARPVFADVEPDTLTMDPELAAARIGQATRAVLTVHLFGRVARTAGLAAACARRGIPLLEDAAQAIGAPGVGKLGLGAALSFFPSKNLGGFGDGGMVLTDDTEFAARLRALRNHGATDKLRHDRIGGNFRLDEMQAALLGVALAHLPRWTARRRAIAARYREALADLPLRLPPDDPGCVWNQFVVRVPGGQRDALRERLAARGVATAIYYPAPLHLQPALAALDLRRGLFPEAERASGEALALPIHPAMTDDQVDRVVKGLSEVGAKSG